MEPAKSTKQLSESPAAERPLLPDFDLPDGEPFEAFPPRLSLLELHQRCQQLRKRFPHAIPSPKERWANKIDVPFEL